MRRILEVLKKHIIIVLLHMVYSAIIFTMLFKGRKAITFNLDQLTDFSFIKGVFLDETQRLLVFCFVSAVFLSIIYYFIAESVKNRKIYIHSFLKGAAQYSVLNFLSYIMWIPFCFIFTMCIGIISIPSIVIAFPLLEGKEEFFIPAIILWVVTVLVILFTTLLFNLYMIFWYPNIFLAEKNIFIAFKQSSKIVNDYFWRLIFFSVISLFNSSLFLFIIICGFFFVYQSVEPLTNVLLWVGVIFTSLFNILLKTYTFVFVREYGKLSDEEFEVPKKGISDTKGM
ncbi:MAG: hypothetical protein AB7G87_06155 [Clostridia bacterium]